MGGVSLRKLLINSYLSYNTHMRRIFSSASKLVFLLVAITACFAFIKGTLPVDQFMLLATAAFLYYFRKDGNDTPEEVKPLNIEK